MTTPTKSEVRERISPIFDAISGYYTREDKEAFLEGEDLTADAFLDQAICVEYIVDHYMAYLGAKILVNYDGASIWINTQEHTIDAYWDGETCRQYWYCEEMDLHGACREMFEIAVSNRYSKGSQQ